MDNATSNYVLGVAHAAGNGQFPTSDLSSNERVSKCHALSRGNGANGPERSGQSRTAAASLGIYYKLRASQAGQC